jgi:hypothetical protein
MNSLTCANPNCTDALHADSDHDRNEIEEYYFHPECWRDVAGSWEEPA